MKTLIIVFTLTALALASPACAQLVNDGATNTLSNVTNSIPGNVTVGANGSLLALSKTAKTTGNS